MLSRITRQYDEQLQGIPGLLWLPWIGLNYANPPGRKRLLVVAESHYTSKEDPAAAEREIEEVSTDREYTRECVCESLVKVEWTVPTFRNLNKLLLGQNGKFGEQFWMRSGYCNLVQRQLRLYNGERPNYMDFIQGWRTLFRMIEVIEPSAILMIGVEATNHLPSAIEGTSVQFDPVQRGTQIGRTYARHTRLRINARGIPLHSVQHCGKYFANDRWRRYLLEQCADVAPLLHCGSE
jgi:hypothetical protein